MKIHLDLFGQIYLKVRIVQLSLLEAAHVLIYQS